MKTQRRSNRLWNLAALLGIALLSSGCIIHTYETRDDFYETQSRTRTTTSSYSNNGYVGGHVIPDANGGGWCFVSAQHNHGYAPDYPSYYGNDSGYYAYRGPVSFYFYGYHPVPTGHGSGWCNLHGRHVHRYHPGRRGGWQYHRGRRYYWYDDRAPRRDPHPAEPAWADRNPRGEPTRGHARGNHRGPSRGTAAGPATSAAGATRGQPAAGRPASAAGATSGQPAPARPANGGQARGHDVRGGAATPAPRSGWTPTTGPVDLGVAESERGGTYEAKPATGYGVSRVAPTATPATPSARPTFNANPSNPTYTPQPARPTYGATPTTPSYTAPRATIGGSTVAPAATGTGRRPTFQGTSVKDTRTPVSQPSGTVDPRWRVKPRNPGTATSGNTSARTPAGRRHVGPSKAERAKQGDKEDREERGLKKKKASSSGTKIRLTPARPVKSK